MTWNLDDPDGAQLAAIGAGLFGLFGSLEAFLRARSAAVYSGQSNSNR